MARADGLLPVGLRLLDQPLGLAAGARDDVVAIGLGLVLRPLAVGLRALHVAEGVDHLGRRVDLLQLDLRRSGCRRRTRSISACSCSRALGLDRARGPRSVRLDDRGLADDLAHHALGRGLHRVLGVADVEQESAPASLILQSTTKLMSMMFSSPVSISASSDDVPRRAGACAPSSAGRERKPISIRLTRVTWGFIDRLDRRGR